MNIKLLHIILLISIICLGCHLGQGSHATATYIFNDSSHKIEINYYKDGGVLEKYRIYLKQKERYLVGTSYGRGRNRGGIRFIPIVIDSTIVSTNGKNYSLVKGTFSVETGLPFTHKNNLYNTDNYIYTEVSSTRKLLTGEYIFYFRDFD